MIGVHAFLGETNRMLKIWKIIINPNEQVLCQKFEVKTQGRNLEDPRKKWGA